MRQSNGFIQPDRKKTGAAMAAPISICSFYFLLSTFSALDGSDRDSISPQHFLAHLRGARP
jgi:hypothetical protein